MAVKTERVKLKQDSYVKVTDYLGKRRHLVERMVVWLLLKNSQCPGLGREPCRLQELKQKISLKDCGEVLEEEAKH